jgi:YfiH family protein
MSDTMDTTAADQVVQTSSGVELVIPAGFQNYPEIVAAVSTRNGGVSRGSFGMNISLRVGDDPDSVAINRNRILASVGMSEEQVAHPGQIHGDRVEIVRTGGRYPDCDALITPEANLFLAVTIADCVPILLYDPDVKVIAAVHSGWRGSAAGILAKTVTMMVDQFQVSPGRLQAYIGPSAGGCCYEVGEEVAVQFTEAYLRRSDDLRVKLDLKKFNHDILRQSGVPERQIALSTHCTICGKERFHSYRREKEQSGRMMAVIGRKPV